MTQQSCFSSKCWYTNIWTHWCVHTLTNIHSCQAQIHTYRSHLHLEADPPPSTSWTLCKAFMVTALSVHFSGAGPWPAAGLLPAAAPPLSLSLTDKKNLQEQCVQLCVNCKALQGDWGAVQICTHPASRNYENKQLFRTIYEFLFRWFDSLSTSERRGESLFRQQQVQCVP